MSLNVTVVQIRLSDCDGAVLGTGISTQAGAGLMNIGLAVPVSAPALTYFERLFWSQESQNAAAAVTGKTVR